MAQLPFNQTSGTTAYDVTSNGWNGTLVNGASWAAGGNGSNAVSLNGTNQYVALPSGVVAGDNAITVAAWVNLNSVSNWSRIFDFGSGTNYLYVPVAEERGYQQDSLWDQAERFKRANH